MEFWSNVDAQEREREERLSGSRALIAARRRVDARFGRYLNGGAQEFESRYAYLEDELRKTVAGACEDFDADFDKVWPEIVAHVRKESCGDCGCKDCSSDGGCSCGDCPGCGDKKSNVKTAADPDEDDHSQMERVKLPKADEDGLADVGSPKIDHDKWTGLPPIDVKSERHQLEHQDATDRADHAKDFAGYESPDAQPESALRRRDDLPKAGPDGQDAGVPTSRPHTQVFPNTNQADPVTSSWRVLG